MTWKSRWSFPKRSRSLLLILDEFQQIGYIDYRQIGVSHDPTLLVGRAPSPPGHRSGYGDDTSETGLPGAEELIAPPVADKERATCTSTGPIQSPQVRRNVRLHQAGETRHAGVIDHCRKRRVSERPDVSDNRVAEHDPSDTLINKHPKSLDDSLDRLRQRRILRGAHCSIEFGNGGR